MIDSQSGADRGWVDVASGRKFRASGWRVSSSLAALVRCIFLRVRFGRLLRILPERRPDQCPDL